MSNWRSQTKSTSINPVNTSRFIIGLTLDLQNTNKLGNSNISKSENNIMIFSGVDKISQSRSGQVII